MYNLMQSLIHFQNILSALQKKGTILNIFLIAPSLYFCNIWGFFGDLQFHLIEAFIFATLIAAVDPVAVEWKLIEIEINWYLIN